MKIRKTLNHFFLAILLIGGCLSEAAALSTRDQILDEISVSSAEKYSVIKISFNFPVRYLRHYPLSYGKEVRIQLEPIITSLEDRAALNGRESLFPPEKNKAGVTRVEYEGSDFVEPTLRVVFDKERAFEAKQGPDFRSLLILVPQKTPPAQSGEKTISRDSASPEKDESEKSLEKTSPAPAMPSKPTIGTLSEKRQKDLLEEGERVLQEENFSRAVQIYTKLLESQDTEVRELAQYNLGVAQESQNFLAHAKAEYRNYLRDYPEGDKVDDVRERLRILLTARPLRLGAPDDVLGDPESLWESEYFGSLSVFYDRDESFLDDEDVDEGEDDSIVNFSSITTGFDGTYRLQSETYRFEAVAIGSYEGDLEDSDNETRVSAAYLDFRDHDRSFDIRLGRQSGNKGGVLGRFDGGRFGYQLSEKLRLNMVAGFPVERSSDGFESDKYFYGVNFDLGRFWQSWDFNLYFINQIADDIDDRRAIGSEVRYASRNGSFFSLLDYDLLFDEVNIFLFAGNYLLPNEKTRINLSADFRSSPSLSTSNGLIGQLSPSLELLKDSIGERALRDLARDRTLDSSFITMGLSHPISDNFQIAGDVSWSRLDGAPASGGVDAIESTGDEWFYTLQLIGTDLFKPGDLSSIALRYADTKPRDTYTLNINSRYPISETWRVNPRLQVDYRENKTNSGSQWRFRPGLRLEYLMRRNLRFEIEGEYSWADKDLVGLADERKGYQISIGFRWDF